MSKTKISTFFVVVVVVPTIIRGQSSYAAESCGVVNFVDDDFNVSQASDLPNVVNRHWPWMVSIGNYADGRWNHTCAGTVIHKERFL